MSLCRSIWLLLLLATLTAGAEETGDPVLAWIGDRSVTLRQVREYARNKPILRGYLSTGYPGVRRVLEDLIAVRLLNREGERLGIPRQPEDDDDLYAFRVKGRLLPKCHKPDEAGARAFYERHPEQFSTPVFVRLQRLELPAAARIDGRPAEAFLKQAAEKIRAGALAFEDLKAHCPTSGCLQDLGFVRLDGLDIVRDSAMAGLRAARPGDVVGPVRAGDAVFLYRVTARRDPILAPWEQVRDEAEEKAQRFCRRQAFAELRRQLYQRYQVRIDEDGLRALR
ncbi:MAG TPA: peptidyl-prolyl cis-trans isomerase [Sedimenticola sp.]|nr:peptidyl-prolyl cis-trans isomerase [Sedimenticola sp.]